MRFFMGLVIVFLLVISATCHALERFDIITTEELEQMLAQRADGKLDFVLINALDEIIFRNASIPGSVNVPWSRVDETIDRLGNDRDKLMLTY